MKTLKYILPENTDSLNDKEFGYNIVTRYYVDNKGEGFTGIGLVIKDYYNFYLNSTCIKAGMHGSKKILETQFNKAIKEHIFK